MIPISQPLSQYFNLPVDQIRIIISQMYSLILSFILYFLKDPALRKLYSLFFGTLLQIYVYKKNYYQYAFLLLQIVGVYLICMYYRSKCGLIVTVLSVFSLSVCHIYRMLTDYGGWQIQISTLLMMTVCKFSLFAYQCQDGYLKNQQFQKLTQQQKSARLTELPSFYDYICYIQFLPTAVMGPSLDYKEYSTFIDLKKQYVNIPNTITPVLKSLLEASVCIAIYQLVYRPHFPIEFMKTDKYLNWEGISMLLYSAISVHLMKFKYYFAWKISSCSIHACGISYEKTQLNYEQKRENLFTLHSHVNILNVECSMSIRQKIANWNMSVQTWLRRSIYQRVRIYGQFLTFMVSAFWHGFYGGYYISFALWFLMLFLAQTVYRINRNHPLIQQYFNKTGFIGKGFVWLFVNVMFANFGIYFQILSIKSSWKVLKAYKFVPVIIVLLLTIALHFSGLGKKKQNKSKKIQEKQN